MAPGSTRAVAEAVVGAAAAPRCAPVDALLVGGGQHHKRMAEGLQRLEVLILPNKVGVQGLQVVGLQGCRGRVAGGGGGVVGRARTPAEDRVGVICYRLRYDMGRQGVCPRRQGLRRRALSGLRTVAGLIADIPTSSGCSACTAPASSSTRPSSEVGRTATAGARRTMGKRPGTTAAVSISAHIQCRDPLATFLETVALHFSRTFSVTGKLQDLQRTRRLESIQKASK